MKVRNEANRKVIDIIDSQIERNKKSIITPGRGSAKTISIFAYNLSIMKANAALYAVKENIANSVFKINLDTAENMFRIEIEKINKEVSLWAKFLSMQHLIRILC